MAQLLLIYAVIQNYVESIFNAVKYHFLAHMGKTGYKSD